MKLSHPLLAGLVASICAGGVYAAVSAEEAKQLGTTLTFFGAEKAGNKDGSIPEYMGGLPNTPPPGFKKDVMVKWPNPFADEKPLFSINAQNMDKYADKLSEASKTLLKRYPSYRMDIYPSHRVVNYPQFFLDATARNATTATTGHGGVTVENVLAGLPFPIPKNGYEVMWNHLTHWSGSSVGSSTHQYYVDANGNRVLGGKVQAAFEFPNNIPGMTADQFSKQGGWYFRAAYNFTSPPRILGDCTLLQDSFDPIARARKSYQYSASTRRVRLAPDVAYDTPIASSGGIMTYDDAGLYQAKMDRFDFKLVGKKEMYIPYNNYDAVFYAPADKLLPPKHANPDYLRWEPHRVWMVEATLKPGLRHIYSKRMFYLDEDWMGAGVSDEYDPGGKLYKGMFSTTVWLYGAQMPTSFNAVAYDFATGNYVVLSWHGGPQDGMMVRSQPWPQNTFTPDGLVARSKQ